MGEGDFAAIAAFSGEKNPPSRPLVLQSISVLMKENKTPS